MTKKYALNFHQTFSMELPYISYILSLEENNNGYTKEEISEITGIPTGKSSGKVEPHIKYSQYCNLIIPIKSKGYYFLKKTELGKTILVHDKFLKEEITLELLLYFLTSKSVGADQWYFFIRELLSEKEISKEFINNSIKIRYESTKDIKISPVINTVEELKENILSIKPNTLSKINKKVKTEFKFVYAYTLLFEIENLFTTRNEITYNELNWIKWREGHFMSIDDEYKVLEWLESIGVIRLNKQLTPITIIKIKDSKDILKLLYSELI